MIILFVFSAARQERLRRLQIQPAAPLKKQKGSSLVAVLL
jgi:hypothetical protein